MEPSLYSQSERLSRAGFSHAFFTRRGGASRGAYSSLNLSFDVGDRPQHVAENRRRVAQVLGVADGAVYVPRQIHGSALIVVDGSTPAAEIATRPADAILSDGPGLACAVRTADCVPILIGDRETRRVAAVHAGWRGVTRGVLVATLDEFLARGSRPEHLIAAIGPHISAAAFEVGEDVARELAAVTRAEGVVTVVEGQKPHVALAPILIAQLTALGVPRAQVDTVPGCTFTDRELFFSYRRDGQQSGRQLSAIVSEAILGAATASTSAQHGGG